YRQVQRQPGWQQSFIHIRDSFTGAGFAKMGFVFFLMFINWGLEARKWQLSLRSLITISFTQSLKAVFTGTTTAFFTPNRVGEYFGRILYIPEGSRLKAISLTIVCSMAQLLVTIIIGIFGLVVFGNYAGIEESESVSFWLRLLLYSSITGGVILAFLYFRLVWMVRMLEKISLLRRYMRYVKVLNQFKGVMGSSRISSDDKHSLQQFVDSLTDVQRDMQATGNQTLSCGRFAAQAETTDNDEFNQKLIDMMVIALSCGLTRVATYDLNWEACAQRYGGADYHGAQGVHGCDSGPNYENIANWTESFVKHYAYMVKKMDQAGLLESSLVIYANEMSSSVPNHHGVDIPVLTAGSLNGKFRTGEYISYYNLARQIGYSGGIQQNADLSRTNGYAFYPGRKWNEMLISMFSALGVPAGEYERDGKKGFGSYTCNVPADKIGQCGNPQSDTALQAAMISYYAKEYKESVYATLPYLTG
ncbi:MAG: DUF1552 domain-containing protein, partial [Proteobacteria bacterium]